MPSHFIDNDQESNYPSTNAPQMFNQTMLTDFVIPSIIHEEVNISTAKKSSKSRRTSKKKEGRQQGRPDGKMAGRPLTTSAYGAGSYHRIESLKDSELRRMSSNMVQDQNRVAGNEMTPKIGLESLKSFTKMTEKRH